MNGRVLELERPVVADDASDPTMGVLLERVKDELDSLTQIVGTMQVTLSPLLIDAASRHPEASSHAQNLDLVWQTLGCLSRVLDSAARERASHHMIDMDAIAEDLPLADLSARLRGLACDRLVHGDDLELF